MLQCNHNKCDHDHDNDGDPCIKIRIVRLTGLRASKFAPLCRITRSHDDLCSANEVSCVWVIVTSCPAAATSVVWWAIVPSEWFSAPASATNSCALLFTSIILRHV